MQPFISILTERLIIRWLRPDDLREFQAYRHDPEVGRFQGWTPVSDDQALEFIESVSAASFEPRGEWVQFGIALRETDRLIGDIGLYISADDDRVELGFTLDRAYHGQGFAYEALSAFIPQLFAQAGVAQIEAYTDARNIGSIRLLERLGMIRVKEEMKEYRGELCEEYAYELRRP